MTKIRYRAFDKHMKTMGEVTSIRFFDHQYDHVSARFTIRGKTKDENYNVGYDGSDNIILMQDTGLTDKNGVKIFEGDIVIAWSQGYQATGEVKQRIDGLWLMYPAYQHGKRWGLCPNPKGATTVEIIGNIHDNPELMEVTE